MMWLFMLVIPVFERWKKENYEYGPPLESEFQASLD